MLAAVSGISFVSHQVIATYYKKVSVFISEDTWSALFLLLGEQENDSLDAFTLMQLVEWNVYELMA